MKKLSKLARYILKEEEAPAPEPTPVEPSAAEALNMGTKYSQIAGVGRIDLGNFNTIVVKNPTGKGLEPKKDKRDGFGFGMGIDAPTIQFATDLIRNYGSGEDKFVKDPETGEERERFTDEADAPNWQQVNRAVGNYVRQNIDNVLLPMRLGRVAKNPVGRYDGMDTTKIGTIMDKKYGRNKIKFGQF
jgi:hypothetical protein